MRPQDMYPNVGHLTSTLGSLADDLAVLRVACETWDPQSLRVDSGSPWTVDETSTAVTGDLAAAEESLRAAIGSLEAAWSALGRLAAE